MRTLAIILVRISATIPNARKKHTMATSLLSTCDMPDPPPMPDWKIELLSYPGWNNFEHDNDCRAAVIKAMEAFVKHLAPQEGDRLPVAIATKSLLLEVLIALEMFGVLRPNGFFHGRDSPDRVRLNRVVERIADGDRLGRFVLPEYWFERMLKDEGLGHRLGKWRIDYADPAYLHGKRTDIKPGPDYSPWKDHPAFR